MRKVPWAHLYPNSTPVGNIYLTKALNMLEGLLNFDPKKRMTIEKALNHEYLASYHDSEDEVYIFKS
jgi:serine/threonine protein kinase